MTRKETDQLFYSITSNGCREMDKVRFHQAINEALHICGVMPRFLKTKYSLEELEQYIMELSARTDRHIYRGKLEDIEKLIRWRRRYDALNGA